MIPYEVSPEYITPLEEIAGAIQASDELERYLEEEEEEQYTLLKDQYEPLIGEVYRKVAADHPLQLVDFEQILLDPSFEGLYLPRILGHAVLRGEVNEHCKYVRPQEHFKEVLLTICNSSNFDILKKRIGQTIQIGFALSSDIWVTSLINDIQNKRVRNYLQGQKNDKYRNQEERETGHRLYLRQFKNDNYQSIDFPETLTELRMQYNHLKDFLLYRVHTDYDNTQLLEPLNTIALNEDLYDTPEQLKLMLIYAGFMETDDENRNRLMGVISKIREVMEDSDEIAFHFIHDLHTNPNTKVTPEVDRRWSAVINKQIDDRLNDYFTLMDAIHDKGYNTNEVQELIRVEYNKHPGLSLFNENIRRTIYGYFQRFITHLEPGDYTEFFEITKLMGLYQELFGNQKFVQDLKELSMAYVKRLLKKFVDKRGRDYQDIKKFVSTTFQDFGYLAEKEVVELFKTRRKRKKTESA